MEDTLPPLTPEQIAYLAGLRNGRTGPYDDSKLLIKPTLSPESQRDFTTFRTFLSANGHPNPQPADLYLTVLKQGFINLLNYADDRECLILQCCFGFDIYPVNVPPNRVIGQLRLVQKGNFQQIQGRVDEEYFHRDTVYKNGDGNLEPFMNMSYGQAITPGDAAAFTNNFRAIYPPGRTQTQDPYILGFLLPVRALLKLFSDQAYPFVRTDVLTFRWGLTAFDSSPGSKLGNFTLVVGTHDLFIDPTIEFRSEDLRVKIVDGKIIVDGRINDCPPNRGC